MIRFVAILAAILALAAFAAPGAASASLTKDTKLFTKLRLNGVPSGYAVYKEKPKNGETLRVFKVQVEKMKPGTVLAVSYNGKVLKKITVGPLGTVEMTMKNITDDPPGPQFVPTMKPGDIITVGPLSGSLNVVF